MSQQPAWLQGPPTGQGTKYLCIAAIVASILSTIAERSSGFGASHLSFDGNAVLQGEIWRIFTYPFIMPSPFNLLLSLFIFWLFGRSFESQWGTPYFVRFVGLAAVGAAILAVPINLLLNPVLENVLQFRDQTVASGPNPVIDAFLVHLAIVAPRSNILLGFVFPVQTKQVVYFVLGIELLFGLMTAMATISVTLGGIAMGYLLTTGKWRPSSWGLPKPKSGKRKAGHLRVVKDDEPTLH